MKTGKGRNTTAQLIDVHHMILSDLEEKKSIGAVVIFLDYSSAFDKVLISELIQSLEKHDVGHSTDCPTKLGKKVLMLL